MTDVARVVLVQSPTIDVRLKFGAPGPQGPAGSVTILSEDAEYWLDAVDGDDTNAGTEEAPWQTLERAAQQIATYGEIHAALRFNLVQGTFTWQGVVMPRMATPQPVLQPDGPSGGKVVYYGVPTITDQTVTVSSAATVHSFNVTGTAVDRVGWMLEGLTGANANTRRLIVVSEDNGGNWQLAVDADLPEAPTVGDTFRIYRPAAEISWGGDALSGLGRAAFDPTGNDQGVYFANVRWTGAPNIMGINTWLYGVEHDEAAPIFFSGCVVGFGLVGAAMPWLHEHASLWRGLGLTQRRSSASVTEWLAVQSDETYAWGYLCGTTWAAYDFPARLTLLGGALWGAPERPTLEISDGVRADIGLSFSTAVPMLTASSNGTAVIYAHGAGTVVRIGQANIDSGAGTATLALSTHRAHVEFTAAYGQVTGNATQKGCHVHSLGSIAWQYEPTFTAGTDLTVESVTGDFSELSTAPSTVFDPDNPHSYIARISTP